MTKKRIFLSPPHMGGEELQFIHEAFESNYIAPLGPMVDAFENEFAKKIGTSYALALSSGTAAMHLALRHLGIGPGDECFASTLTFIGSVSPVVFQGATPVFIDSDRSTWNMDPDLLAGELEACAKRGKLPKAVISTDLYGQCADYDQIFNICRRYDVPVIIDAAEAMGAYYRRTDKSQTTEDGGRMTDDGRQTADGRNLNTERKGQGVTDKYPTADQPTTHNVQPAIYHHAGYGARAAIYSFNGNKIMTTSGGGMLASDDRDLIDHARKLSQQARESFIHYEHEEIGYNYRMSNILAAIGLGQLKVLDDRVAAKQNVFNYYKKALDNIPGIEFMPEASYGVSNKWLTVILISPEKFGADHEEVRLALEAENIESRPIWKPMHLQPVFNGTRLSSEKKLKKFSSRAVRGQVSEDLFNRGLCLPSGTSMTEEDLNRVIKTIRSCKK
jgi:dTDP-4-amino-4,6-dideoxygalactose transaminase